MVICQHIQKQKSLRGCFLSFTSTEQRWLWVETKDFMSSLAENDDIKLYNKDVKKRLLYNYGDKTEFCPINRVGEKRDSQGDV